MLRDEPLLPTYEGGDVARRDGRPWLRVALLFLSSGALLLCVCLVRGAPSDDALLRSGHGQAEEAASINLASGPLGLHGALGPVGVLLREIYDACKPFSFIFKYFGIVLFILPFLLAGLDQARDFSGFVSTVKGLGLPCPTLMAAGGLFCMFAGTLCYLTGVPVLMEWGAEFLAIFLIMATYFGHYRAWARNRAPSELTMILKNISMFGGCLLTIGFVVPEIGSEHGPIGLHGALGPVGVELGMIYAWFKPYAYIFKSSGVCLFVLPFLLAGVYQAKEFSGFVSTVKDLGLPCPTLTAAGGLFCMFAGTLCYLTGVPVLMEWGAEFLAIFLIMATYFGHYREWRRYRATDDIEHTLKNISLIGVCFLTIGVLIPKIGHDG